MLQSLSLLMSNYLHVQIDVGCLYCNINTYILIDSQKIQIDIYDSDYDADDYIGSAEFLLRDIVPSFGHQLNRDLVPAGNGHLLVFGLVNGTRSSGGKFDYRLANPSKVVPSVLSHGVPHKERVQSPKFFKL
ncbi:unnamed protein product [Allacma fusca]|uniref:Uncharacterized protein n=1 Tax=Allacma fusca TaxID=39272 RepID=A0A8J2KYC5_9HEXA|nr:unnamed protein product [Allacma fusca]